MQLLQFVHPLDKPIVSLYFTLKRRDACKYRAGSRGKPKQIYHHFKAEIQYKHLLSQRGAAEAWSLHKTVYRRGNKFR